MKRVSQSLTTVLAVTCAIGFIYLAVFAGANSVGSAASEDPYPYPSPEYNPYPLTFLPLVFKPYEPLFVGLSLQWDSDGYIQGSGYTYYVGHHYTVDLIGMYDADSVIVDNYSWYDPNPFGWSPESWQTLYSVKTGYSEAPAPPLDWPWKWGNPWIMPYDWHFQDGQTVSVGGQAFIVSGPYAGTTEWGQSVRFWQLVNRDLFLFWDGGGDWTQYVFPGHIVLRYDAGQSRLQLYRNVFRTYFYQGTQTVDTVQYIDYLTYASSFPGTDSVALGASTTALRESVPAWGEIPDLPEEALRALPAEGRGMYEELDIGQ